MAEHDLGVMGERGGDAMGKGARMAFPAQPPIYPTDRLLGKKTYLRLPMVSILSMPCERSSPDMS